MKRTFIVAVLGLVIAIAWYSLAAEETDEKQAEPTAWSMGGGSSSRPDEGPTSAVVASDAPRDAHVPDAALPIEGSPLGSRLIGIVVEADGRPAQAEVELTLLDVADDEGTLYDEAVGMVDTDGAGRFAFAPISAGRYEITARLPLSGERMRDRWPGRKTVVTLSVDGLRDANVELAFPPVVEVRGTVVDDVGAPVREARVEATSADTATAGLRSDSMAMTITDDGGVFVLTGLHSAPTVVTASKRGFESQSVETSGTSDDPLRITLPRDCVLSGRVVSEDGVPVQRFELSGGQLFSDAGTFRVPVPCGEGWLTVRAAQFAAHEVYLPFFRGPRHLGDIVLSKGRRIQGTVVDGHTGLPIANAVVDVVLVDPARPGVGAVSGVAPARTDESGRFDLPSVESHVRHLVGRHPEYKDGWAPLGPGDSPSVKIILERGGTIALYAVGTAGAGMSGTITAELVADRRYKRRCVLDESGRCAIGGLEPGRHELAFPPRMGLATLEVTIRDRETQFVEWRVAPVSTAGRE